LSKNKLPVRQESHSGFGDHNTGRGIVKAKQALRDKFPQRGEAARGAAIREFTDKELCASEE